MMDMMDEVISNIATNEIPTTGQRQNMSGIRLRSKVPLATALEKLKNSAAGGCPINRRVPTKMSREACIASCVHFKAIADKDRDCKNKYAISTPQGFRTSNRRVCIDCEIGEAIAAGEPFEPPLNITFIELTDLKGRPMLKDKPVTKPKPILKTSTKKLTAKDVVRIRKMHKEGYSVPGLCEIFPVTTSTMYRVVNYESWRNVK